MKRLFCVLSISFLCLAFCSCNREDSTNQEVAEKLNGVWAVTWDSALGEMVHIYTFEHSSGNAGNCTFINACNGDVIVNYSVGSFGVNDGKIDVNFFGSTDESGNLERFDSVRSWELYYTYDEDGKVKVKDEFREFYQIEK